MGDETLHSDHAQIEFLFDGFTYRETDDLEYSSNGYPEFYFTDGTFVGFSFEADLKSTNGTPGSYLFVDGISGVYYSFDGSKDEFKAHLEFDQGKGFVPEPSSSMLILVSMLGGCCIRRRSNSSC